MNEINWNAELVDQLTWHWDNQLRPRLSGLTDEEYLWEPVAGCWNLRRRGEGAGLRSPPARARTCSTSIRRNRSPRR